MKLNLIIKGIIFWIIVLFCLFFMFCHYRAISFTSYNIEKYHDMDINDITPSSASYTKIMPVKSKEDSDSDSYDEEDKEKQDPIKINNDNKRNISNEKTRGKDKMIF